MRNATFAVIGVTFTSLAIGLTGCANTSTATKSSQQQPASGFVDLSGKVAETMDGGGYTYVCLEKNGQKTWAALPATKITVGQTIKLLPGADMPGFSSKALNRTFDHVYFSGGVDTGEAAKAPMKPQPAGKAAKAVAMEPPVLAGKVVESINATSYTYLLIEKDGKRGWSAVPTTTVKVGDEVELIPGVDMGAFKSATLDRTFDNIHFSAGLRKGTGAAPAANNAKTDAAKAATPAAATGTPAATAPLPPGHPKVDAAAAEAAAAPAVQAAVITGKVVETTDAAGYTYVCLEKDNVKTWAAIPATKVQVGQQLTLPAGNEMHNFTSKSLNRTFEKIIFTNGPQ